jgi:hypothetical protein
MGPPSPVASAGEVSLEFPADRLTTDTPYHAWLPPEPLMEACAFITRQNNSGVHKKGLLAPA